ncbi:MAG: 3-phosphoshikimate 1-carboxyvinyltransferase, partial [Acidobacteria bacterium]|nr:3-phosphoshikimate 1-carboxyvinyltransferase [Acidobacteriota bacterium]
AGRLPNREWEISGRLVPSLIDEIPILAVLGTIAPEGLLIRDALELRVKESDRISAMAENLRRTGVRIDEYEDGMFVHPSARLSGAEVSAFGDHRVAMSMALAGLRAGEPVILDDPEVVGVSFPGFFECLRSLTR